MFVLSGQSTIFPLIIVKEILIWSRYSIIMEVRSRGLGIVSFWRGIYLITGIITL